MNHVIEWEPPTVPGWAMRDRPLAKVRERKRVFHASPGGGIGCFHVYDLPVSAEGREEMHRLDEAFIKEQLQRLRGDPVDSNENGISGSVGHVMPKDQARTGCETQPYLEDPAGSFQVVCSVACVRERPETVGIAVGEPSLDGLRHPILDCLTVEIHAIEFLSPNVKNQRADGHEKPKTVTRETSVRITKAARPGQQLPVRSAAFFR